jgi:hypothetical protein
MRLLLLVSLAARPAKIGVFFDPLVEFHAAEENNNVEMLRRNGHRPANIDISRSD